MKKQKLEAMHTEVGEDGTKYGEFISSYFSWVPLPDQKKIVDELQKMTKSNKQRK